MGTPGLAIVWGPWLEHVHGLHVSLSNATGPLDHGPNQHRLLLVLKGQWNTDPYSLGVRDGAFGQIKGGNKDGDY